MGQGGLNENGGWVGFVMVRLLLLYIVINRCRSSKSVCGGFLCESFINRKLNDGTV